MSQQVAYTAEFFEVLQAGSRRSAREIIPTILEFIQPQSVVDVGCGDGTWLSVFQDFGIQDYLGIDGDYVDQAILQIPAERFLPFNLSQPIQLDRPFDLVVSLEVAEHLTTEVSAVFVDSLTRLGKVILFSAAIPFQGGVDHVNEQWLDYWVALFEQKGYVAIDCLRRRIWQNEKVEFWYAQNTVFFVEKNYLETQPLFKKELRNIGNTQLPLVHPKKYLELVDKYLDLVEKHTIAAKAVEWYAAEAEPRNMSLKKVLQALPIVISKSLKRRCDRYFGKATN
jgi:SAM-dependent methyltransferase